MPVSTLLLVLTLAVTARHSIAQQQPGTVPATVVLPAQAVIAAPPTAAAAAPTQQPPGTFSAAPQPATAAAAAPGAELKPPLMTAAPLLPPVGECEALDEFIKDKYAEFFILSRLINAYTLKNMEPSMPLNSSYAPLTILAPSNVIQFLIQNNVNIKKLAASPLQTILFAPTVAGHFLRGYFPANALPSKKERNNSCYFIFSFKTLTANEKFFFAINHHQTQFYSYSSLIDSCSRTYSLRGCLWRCAIHSRPHGACAARSKSLLGG